MMPIVIANTRPEHFAQLAAHQRICFPTIPADDWMNVEHFAAHVRVFPEGQHVALDGDRVVAQSSTLRVSAAQAFAPHTYREITGANFFTTHDPAGEWLYGADMSVHPDYRGRRISSMLYDARKALIRRLGLRGMVAGGALPGYHHYAGRMSVEAYVAEVVAGRLVDPTLTTQLRNGFQVRGILPGYLGGGDLVEDATLIVWEA
ncbi:MAG: GNAT family N-acetyltransferase [Chloroflexaceae bacterium]|nr:GNAT family N-acetyltransferase [Chloroflexaceae bacterium]